VVSAKVKVGAIAAVLTAALALPAAAQAVSDVAISQAASSTVVKPGGSVTINVTVTNQGTEQPPYGNVYVNLFSLSGHGQPANNPYQSVNPSQGTCSIEPAGAYQNVVCTMGSLPPGASAQITAVVQVNQSMNHIAALLPNQFEGGYQDDDNSDNEAAMRIAADIPPKVTGSKKLKLRGLPDGCFSDDFTLRVKAKATHVKKVVASLFLGFDEEGFGQDWQRSAKGKRLRAKVPVSRIEFELGKVYKLKIKAKRGGHALKKTVAFQLC
jgi:hypothetical protein